LASSGLENQYAPSRPATTNAVASASANPAFSPTTVADLEPTAMESLITQENIQFIVNYLKAGSINHLAAFNR
jgi:hypothetical protein